MLAAAQLAASQEGLSSMKSVVIILVPHHLLQNDVSIMNAASS
jgi:hypothetical protein